MKSVTILPPDDDHPGRNRLEVDVDPDVADSAITKMGDLVAHAGGSDSRVGAEFTAGDFAWNVAVGSDADEQVKPLIWLRSDERVLGAEVDKDATGFTADADVLDTIADFHAAMSALNKTVEIRQPDLADESKAAGLDVKVWTGKEFPTAAVSSITDLRKTFPTASVDLTLGSGSTSELSSAVALPAGTEPRAAVAAVNQTIAPSVGADATRLSIGVVNGGLAAYTEARYAVIAQMAGVPDLTNLALGDGSVGIQTSTLAGWAAAQDAAAGIGEPFTVKLHVGDLWLETEPIPASDPMRTLAPAITALPSALLVTASPGKITVTLTKDVVPADLEAMVTQLVATGLAKTVEFSLEANDDGDRPVVVKVENGTLTQPVKGYDDLVAPFLDAWHAKVAA